MKNLLFLVFASFLSAQTPNPNCVFTEQQFLNAIQIVETGSTSTTGPWPPGDGGRAIGPFQIHEAYWIDATDGWSPRGTYQECGTSHDYSKRVVLSYMKRYSRTQYDRLVAGTATWADVEKMARIHNGGPTGHTRNSTKAYWDKVKAELMRICP